MSATDILGKIGEKVGGEIKTANTALTNHTSTTTGNPHGVTASDVGLGNVDNTALSTWAGSSNITTVGTLATGTIPYSLLSGVPDVNSIVGDLSIGGNLTVNGTQTILKTQTVEVEDNEIELNLGSSGAETAQTSGIAVNRGVATSGSGNGDITFDLTLASTAFDLECTGIQSVQTPNGSGFTPSVSNGYTSQSFVKASDTDANGNPYFISADNVFFLVYRANLSFDNDTPASGDSGYNAWVITRNTKDSSPIKEVASGYQRVIVYSMYTNSTGDNFYDLFDTSASGNYQNLTTSTENGDTVYEQNNEYTDAPNSLIFRTAANGQVGSPYPSSLSFQQASSDDANGNLYYDDPSSTHVFELRFGEDSWDSEDSNVNYIGYRIWDTSVSDWVRIKDTGGLGSTSSYLYSWVSYADADTAPGDPAEPWAIEDTTQDIYGTTVMTSADLIISNASGSTQIGTGGTTVEDKAKVQWDDSGQGTWKLLLGTADADLTAGNITAATVSVPNATGFKINNVPVGDYSTFELAFNAAIV